ncbi:PP2C family protein-serine/threonine phosphatase [Actinomadura rugatobispora]|uniref:PP2C family protein-serine/threonine phosphatase n=1 Tax=Actinomadura rugatobispora TaxID=1994 RepID=A0ABW1A4S8_9ACTN|nr:PP2C family protein-serine/threonine phosphatase [Actinomadura rugatobispora]
MDTESAPGRERMLTGLLRAARLATLEQLPKLVNAHAAAVGLTDVQIYVSDLQDEVLCLLTGRGYDAGRGAGDRPAELQVEGTVAGRAFQLGQITPAAPAAPGGAGEYWMPLLNGAERLGVLRVTALPGPGGGEPARNMRDLADMVALLVVSKRGVSDAYARLVRRRQMNVPAEMQWRLIPPTTFATDRLVIGAVIEPAYEVSGDAFDYGFTGDIVHMGVFDAMGHDAAAGLTANLAVAAGRNHRRQSEGLAGTAARIEEVLYARFHGDRFATGLLAELDCGTGLLGWISRGHHPPVIIRSGRTVILLECPDPAPPMGMGLEADPLLCREQLEPGDRLLLYTDGITEARGSEGREFGLDRFTDFLIRHHADGLPVQETLRRLIRHHLDYHGGWLNDDATVLLLEWHGPTPYPEERAGALAGRP